MKTAGNSLSSLIGESASLSPPPHLPPSSLLSTTLRDSTVDRLELGKRCSPGNGGVVCEISPLLSYHGEVGNVSCSLLVSYPDHNFSLIPRPQLPHTHTTIAESPQYMYIAMWFFVVLSVGGGLGTRLCIAILSLSLSDSTSSNSRDWRRCVKVKSSSLLCSWNWNLRMGITPQSPRSHALTLPS